MNNTQLAKEELEHAVKLLQADGVTYQSMIADNVAQQISFNELLLKGDDPFS